MPFVFFGMAVALHAGGLDYSLALLAYGATIISFLCGIHWAVFLFFSQNCPRNLLFHSNAISLLGWLSVLYTTTLLEELISLCMAIQAFVWLSIFKGSTRQFIMKGVPSFL
jgi:hypothetical protein